MPGLLAVGAAKMESTPPTTKEYDDQDDNYAGGCDATEQLIDELMTLETNGSDTESDHGDDGYYAEDSDDDGIILEKYGA
jgi:hypothetical protein